MKIIENVSKELVFSFEDRKLIDGILRSRIGSKPISAALDWNVWWMPLFGAWGKISGTSGDDTRHVMFKAFEKTSICDVLRDAYKDETADYDGQTREKIKKLLEGIFYS